MSQEDTSFLKAYKFWDSGTSVSGLAYVKHGFKAELHWHAEDEIYYFLYGEGEMRLGDKVLHVVAPAVIRVPGSVPHAMTPISNFVVLLYHFPNPKKKFDDIEYHFNNTFIQVPTYPSKSFYSCPAASSRKEEKDIATTSKL